jgi:nucleoside-diphosphate-sugar epimerase
VSKLLGEQMLAEAAPKIASLSIRLPSVIGPGARYGWLTGIARKLTAGAPVSFVNPKTLFNNIVHIDELAAFVHQLIEAPIEGADVVTLAASDAIPVGDVIERLKNKLRSRSALSVSEAPDAPAYSIDATRAEQRYGWRSSSVCTLVDRLADSVT